MRHHYCDSGFAGMQNERVTQSLDFPVRFPVNTWESSSAAGLESLRGTIHSKVLRVELQTGPVKSRGV